MLSLLIFLAIAPFAKIPLMDVGAFIPGYESSLVVIDLITVALLLGQFYSFHSLAILLLACGYIFTAAVTVAHAFTFPGLFTPTGLLGAGPQTTAWLYMFWHGGFPPFIIAYSCLKGRNASARQLTGRPLPHIAAAVTLVLALVSGFTLLATQGQSLLPPIMDGHTYTGAMIVVVSSVWLLSAAALGSLWYRKPHSVLDLWLMVGMCAWMVDIALSAVLNHGRFDVGFYAGRVYGLLAASFVLLVLLAESGLLHKKLVQLTATLHQLTTLDALTGIANRRAFDGELDLDWRRAVRNGQPLSLAMIDVDHFKHFNDTYGHAEGDTCLRAVAAALHGGITRASDLVARYGGEEFVVLLPDTEVQAAGLVAERLRAAVARQAIPNQASASGHVTVSIGVACLRSLGTDGHPVCNEAENSSAEALVKMADQALYEAKSLGRNRVVVKG